MTKLIMGADLSTLPEAEAQGARYFDGEREGLADDILISHGVSSVRIRVWNDPFDTAGKPYGGGTCHTANMVTLAKRLKDKGMSFMLDLHYSDFWCDPARQGTPKAWRGMSLDEMCSALRDFTAETVKAFIAAGAAPEYIQVGNEITNGMLWNTAKLDRSSPVAFTESFERLAKLIKAGTAAVREVSDAKIIIHLEQSGKNDLWREWFDEAAKHNMDYDIIGASYYTLWHGTLEEMRANLDDMAKRYDKDIMIVEAAYPFTAKHHDPFSKRLMIDEDFTLADGSRPKWAFSPEGQAQFVRELKATAESIERCRGIYWWEPAWLPTKGSTWATREALRDIGEEDKGTGNEWANQCLFDYEGRALPALYEYGI
ncbi:glycosyl hydrolase 53 family protein [Ruminococcus sp.]|uniref:glycoside hydrolase family 53 protein n=1 Tax=Ruminococcus sp. TaxID=41978 RepID=UPI0025ECCC5D|nr:glycosyl hydrolase 53 family protein [Ruminococcus sp.]MBQ8966693.1 glycosyl hydrolase 53 family protein [Ruminococcus sp.]